MPTTSDAVYLRLSSSAALQALVSDRVFPVIPTENTQLPFVVFGVTETVPTNSLSGQLSLTKVSLQVETYGINLDTAQAVQREVKRLLNNWSGGMIQSCLLVSQSTPADIQDAFHGLQTFTIWSNEDVEGNGSNILTGTNYVQLQACDHTLRVDCDGLTLDGELLGELGLPDQTGQAGQYLRTDGTQTSWEPVPNPDLTPYARKDQSNTFTAPQTWAVGGQTLDYDPDGFGGLVATQGSDLSILAPGTVAAITEGGQTTLVGDTLTALTLPSGHTSTLTGIALTIGAEASMTRTGTTLTGLGGNLLVRPSQTNKVPITARGATGQTADLQRWEDAAGNPVASVQPSGNIQSLGLNVGYGSVGWANGLSWRQQATINGSAGRLKLDCISSGDTAFDAYQPFGDTIQIGLGTPRVAGQAVSINAGSPTTVGVAVKGATGQSADLLQAQNSTGTTVASVSSTGSVFAQNLTLPNIGSGAGYLFLTDSGGSPRPCVGLDGGNNFTVRNPAATGSAYYGTLHPSNTGGRIYFQIAGGNAASISPSGDVEVLSPGQGVVLTSPNGTRYRLVVSDGGTLSTSPA